MDAHLPGSHLGPLGISWEALGFVLGGVPGAFREAAGGSWDLPGTSREAHGASSQNAYDFDEFSQIFEVRLGAQKRHVEQKKHRKMRFHQEVWKRSVFHVILDAISHRIWTRI